MQSDGNSFEGDVVLDSFDNAFRDKGNILECKCVPISLMAIKIFHNIKK